MVCSSIGMLYSSQRLDELVLLRRVAHDRDGDEPVGRQRAGVADGVEHALVDAADQHDDGVRCGAGVR